MKRHYTYRFGLIVLGILLMYTHIVSAQDTLTLDACLREVQSSNPDAKQLVNIETRLGIQQKLNTLKVLPQAQLNGKATWQSDVTSIPLDVPGFEVPMPDQDQYAVTLDIQQSIYNGGATKARRDVLDQESALSTLQYQAGLHVSEELVIDVFFKILLQQQLVVTTDLLIAQLQTTIRSIEHHLAGGTVDKKDLLAAQVKLKEAMQKREEAQYYEVAAKHSLAILMGRLDANFEVGLMSSVNNALRNSFDARTEVRTMDARLSLLQSMERLNQAQYHPRLSAFASLGYGKPGLNFLSDAFDTYAITGLTASIPLTQLYLRTSLRESQVYQLQQEEVQLAKEKLLQNLHVQEQQRLAEIEKLIAWLIEDAEIITMRREMAEVAASQRNAGTLSTTDYLDEITELSLAEERRITHEVLLQRERMFLENLYGISILNH